MLFTTHDPRSTWERLSHLPELRPEDHVELRGLPAGARAAPLDWVCTLAVSRSAYFDRDEQQEVVTETRVVTGWRPEPDPRIRLAGELSFQQAGALPAGLLETFPGVEALGPGLSALRLPSEAIRAGTLARLGERRRWRDLSIGGRAWAPGARAAAVAELAVGFPGLRGLELDGAALDEAELRALAQASFALLLRDLSITGRELPESGLLALADGLGALEHLDLRDARVGSAGIARLAPRLREARQVWLHGCPVGDEGVASLVAAGAMETLEDLGLGGCGLTDRSVDLILAADPRHLRGLWMGGNALTDEGVARLVGSPLFERLEGADLSGRGLTGRSARLLEGHPLAGALRGTARRPGLQYLWFQGRPG